MNYGDYCEEATMHKAIFSCVCGWKGVVLRENEIPAIKDGERKHGRQRPECSSPKITLERSFQVDSEETDLFKEDTDEIYTLM